MPKTVAYVRVSTNKQELENQRHEIARYCEARGLTVDVWDSDTPLVSLLDGLNRGDVLVATSIYREPDPIRIVANAVDALNRDAEIHSIEENLVLINDIPSLVQSGYPAIALTLGYVRPSDPCEKCGHKGTECQ